MRGREVGGVGQGGGGGTNGNLSESVRHPLIHLVVSPLDPNVASVRNPWGHLFRTEALALVGTWIVVAVVVVGAKIQV